LEQKEFLTSSFEKVQQSASVKQVFGEPIEANNRTIIPVSMVVYGFGGGSGKGRNNEGNGSGFGTGVVAMPVGVVEISDEGTKFIALKKAQNSDIADFWGEILKALASSTYTGLQVFSQLISRKYPQLK
jgi:uncharacterized spore protein YtfJ